MSRESQMTMTLDPHFAVLMTSIAGVGVLMSLAGLQKSTLEWRRRRRICPSCGRHLRGRACGCN
jgi:NADH pyrophosphatase NudC (nudix superfamily)